MQESQKKFTPEELAAKQLAEWVETEANFSKQCAELVKILDKQLGLKPSLLNPTEKELLTKAREYYQEIAVNPYPWFENNITPDDIKQMPFDNQVKLYDELYSLQDGITPRAEAINRRIETIQWLAIHYDAMNQIVRNKNKFPLTQSKEGEDPYLTITKDNVFKPGEKLVEKLSEQEVAFQYLITPVQRLPRLPLLMRDLIDRIPEPYKTDQKENLTKLQENWDKKGLDTNTLIALSKINKKAPNITKQFIADKKVPYIKPLVETETEERKNLAKQLEIKEVAINTSRRKKEPAKNREKLKETAETLKKKIEAIDSVLEKKTKAINTISTQELELFSAADPEFTSAFLNKNDLIKLTTDIRHHQKEITLLFGEQVYRNQNIKVNYLVKDRLAISDEEFGFLINPDSQAKLTSLAHNDLVKLTVAVRLHQAEIERLFDGKDYQKLRNSLQSANDLHDSKIDTAKSLNTTKALAAISNKELILFSDPKSLLQNLSNRELINLLADIYRHQSEIRIIFPGTKFNEMFELLKNKNDPEIVKAFNKFSPEMVNLFRSDPKATLSSPSLKTMENLGNFNLEVRNCREELTRVFGKDAYQNISNAFAEEYKNRINQQSTLSLSHQELDKLSNKEIKLFTAPKPEDILNTLKTEAPNINALEKLSKDIHAHRQESTKLFGEEAYQNVAKALVVQYALIATEKKGFHEKGWDSKYGKKAEAASLFAAMERSAVRRMATADPKMKEILKGSRLSTIIKPLEEKEPEKPTPAFRTRTTPNK